MMTDNLRTEDGLRTSVTEHPDSAATSVTPSAPQAGSPGKLPFMSIGPKWQVILIGGIFIAINLLVMVAFVVALILRH